MTSINKCWAGVNLDLLTASSGLRCHPFYELILSIKLFSSFDFVPQWKGLIYSGKTEVLALIPLSIEETNCLVNHGLIAVGEDNVAGLTSDHDLGNVSKLSEESLGCCSLGERLDDVQLLGSIPVDDVEGSVAGCHFLNEVVPDRVARGNLRHELGVVRVEVLNDGLLARLVIDDGGTDLGLKGHGHRHGCSLGLLGVLRVELLLLDGLLVQGTSGVIENDDMHCVLKFGRVLERNLEATLAELVLGLNARSLKFLCQFLILTLGRDHLGTLLGDLVGRTGGFDFKINLLNAVKLGLTETFLSDSAGMLLLFSLGCQLTDVNVSIGGALTKLLDGSLNRLCSGSSNLGRSWLLGGGGNEGRGLSDQICLGLVKLLLSLFANSGWLRNRLRLGILL